MPAESQGSAPAAAVAATGNPPVAFAALPTAPAAARVVPEVRADSAWRVLPPFLALLAAAFLLQPYLIDDSFISFRYARHLVEGEGLVYNAGEHVEGYTNFLWVLGVAAGLALGAEAHQAALGLGVAAAATSLFFTLRLAGVLVAGRERRLAPWMLATTTPFVFWTFSGMETVGVGALLVLGAYGVVRAAEGPRFVAGGMLALSMGCLMRPDAVLPLAVSLAALPFLVQDRRGRTLAIAIAVVAAVLVPYAAWKWWYYGALVPNTFHAKVAASVAQVSRGLRHTGTFLIFATASGLVPGALLALVRDDPRIRYLAAIVALHALYVIAVGDDSFPFFRFQVPMLPLYVVLAVCGWETARRALPAGSRILPAAVVAAFLLASFGWGHQGHHRQAIRDKTGINVRFHQIATWLEANTGPTDSIAVVAAGIIPYFSRRPTIDMLGLTDAHIAGRTIRSMGSGMAGHEKGDGRYVLSREPRWILIHPITTSSPHPKERYEAASRRYVSTRELWALPEFHERYELRSIELHGFFFNGFERRDPPAS